MTKEDRFALFDNLKERLDYFHPAFHSMTPEGFNKRLTFLLQCTRQGPSINVEGVNEVGNRPSNMAFGRPPICIMRIGDFYYTKVVIDSVNISYDDSLWDLNPEGIGIQPMIATVDLNMKVIGGSSLMGPVQRLQNALSYNFFANTEVYQHIDEEKMAPTIIPEGSSDGADGQNNTTKGDSAAPIVGTSNVPESPAVSPFSVSSISAPTFPCSPIGADGTAYVQTCENWDNGKYDARVGATVTFNIPADKDHIVEFTLKDDNGTDVGNGKITPTIASGSTTYTIDMEHVLINFGSKYYIHSQVQENKNIKSSAMTEFPINACTADLPTDYDFNWEDNNKLGPCGPVNPNIPNF